MHPESRGSRHFLFLLEWKVCLETDIHFAPNGTRCAGLPFGAACGGLFFVQLENSHEGFSGQLNSTQGTHFFLPDPQQTSLPGDPGALQMLGRNEFALRQGFASGKTLVRRDAPPRHAGWKAEGNALTPHPA